MAVIEDPNYLINAFLEHIQGTHAHIHTDTQILKKKKNNEAVLEIMPMCWQNTGTWF